MQIHIQYATLTLTRLHTHLFGPPWAQPPLHLKHLTIRAAESTCAHVLVYVMIAVPVLPPVACYLSERVKPSGRQGCGDSPVATTACSRGVSKWVIAARHSGRDSTSSSVPSPRHHGPRPLIFCMSLPSEALSPQTTTELPPYPWKSFSLFFPASLLCPSLAIKQSSSYFCPILLLLLLFLAIPPLPKSISRSGSVDWTWE